MIYEEWVYHRAARLLSYARGKNESILFYIAPH